MKDWEQEMIDEAFNRMDDKLATVEALIRSAMEELNNGQPTLAFIRLEKAISRIEEDRNYV